MSAGNFFEDFRIGQELIHATPRTVTTGDGALYTALFGSRFAVQSADTFAAACGLPRSPVDDWLTFHVVFGKTVPDVSLNAVANLGYAEGRFLGSVYPGDTLATTSTVIGLRENANKESGVVYVRSTGRNQRGETVLDYCRWVMVRKRDKASPAPEANVPKLAPAVAAKDLIVPKGFRADGFDRRLSGATALWDNYAKGQKIDHRDGITIEEAEHMMATRLYQNTARVHFDAYEQAKSRFGRRLIYGGHVISLARAISFNGLANACFVAAINGGRHVAPTFGGDTVYAWSEILDKAEIGGRADVGALRVRTVATKNRGCADFPDKTGDTPHEAVVLDLDTWLLIPRKAAP
jgi:2-methylfumaryl-CoA hydratase